MYCTNFNLYTIFLNFILSKVKYIQIKKKNLTCSSIFYQSIVDLQCCANFCRTVKRPSRTYIRLFFYLLFYHGLSHETGHSSLC